MRYKLAVFDMDGTILDTLEDLTDSVNYVMEKYQFPTHTLEEVRGFVGNGIRLLIERAVPEGLSVEKIDRVHRDFMEYYTGHCADKTKPYPGISALLKKLKEAGMLTAVVSNKADSAVAELCERYFDGLFDYAVGDRPGINKKPAPDSVNEVLNRLGVEKKDAVYIGDSDVDMMTARNSGLDEIIVTWGFKDEVFLREIGAQNISHSTDEVEAHIFASTEDLA